MSRRISGLIGLILLTVFVTSSFDAQVRDAAMTNVQSNLATLYAADPVESSICFDDGKGGYVLEKNRVFNRCSHVAFDIYEKDSLTAGIQGGERGYIVDLGNATDLKQEYGYEETVGNAQGYASLHITDNKVMILKSYKEQTYQTLSEGEALFKDGAKASTPVGLGHIYLVRIKRNRPEKEILVKVLVVAYRPGESVVLRWAVL